MNENVTVAKQLPRDKRIEFYQAKYDYYKSFNRILMIVATLTYLSFFITDCGIFGRFAYESILPRAIIVIPIFIFLYMYRHAKDYKVMVVATYTYTRK